MYDVGIVGAGVAGCFAALRMAEKYPLAKTLLVEFGRPWGKRRTRFLEGALGCFPNSDGKLYPNNYQSITEIADGRSAKAAYNWVLEVLEQCQPLKLTKDLLPSAAAQKRITGEKFQIVSNDYYQWKPDPIHKLSRLIADKVETAGITYSFDNEVYKVEKGKRGYIIYSSLGEYKCKKVFICAGRSGWRWTNELFNKLGLIKEDNYAYFGFRGEISASYIRDFNRSHCSLIGEDLEIGPLSWSGTVIPEDHADLVISAFRSNEERWKSDKVSFSVLAKKYYPNAGIAQTDRMGKLAYLLANDRVGKERIRVFLKGETELNLVPEYNWLSDCFHRLDAIIPNMTVKGYYHVPNIAPLTSPIKLDKNFQTELPGLYVAGESARIPGILGAAISGTMLADNLRD